MKGRRTSLHRSLSALLSLIALSHWAAASAPAEVPIGAILPDAVLRGLNGPPRHLSSFRGRPLLINVWASWCGPCRREMASLERLAWQQPRFAMIGISTDDDADAAGRFMQSVNATISHFIDHDLQMESLLGASRLPLTVLVDADGRVLEKVYGAKEWDDAAARGLIESALRPSRRPR